MFRLHLAPTCCVLILLFAAGCSPTGERPAGYEAEASEPPPAEALARAEQVADALGSELMSTLTEELLEGGPVGAVRVCSEVAPEVAASHSIDGVVVRRVSLKVRNPADSPDDHERKVLEQFAAQLARGEALEPHAEVVEQNGQRTLRYLRPIKIMEPCLNCHGSREQMEPELLKLLDERYPNDAAVDYREGDLRGAFSVSVELDEG
jgi:hypothetical protein